MTYKECIDGMQQIIDDSRNKILVRVHAGYLIHAIKFLKEHEDAYENGFNDAMLGKQELMYEDEDGKWYKKDW